MVSDEMTKEVISNFEHYAVWHWFVAALTLSSACIVALGGGIGLMYFFPLKVMPKLIEYFCSDKSNPSELILLVMNGPLAFSFAAISYLAHLLVAVYRYNISLYSHYRIRADALRLVQGDQLTLENLVKYFDPNISVKLDSLPNWLLK